MTGSDIKDIFSSKNNTSNYFSECEKKLRDNKNIKSYWDTSDSNPEILENRKQMDKLKKADFKSSEILHFFHKNYFSDPCKWENCLHDFKFDNLENMNILFKNVNITQPIFNFYENHPFLTPFVGKKYGTVLNKKIKVLYVMESHYLPTFSKVYERYKKYTTSDKKQEWLLKHWYASDWTEQISLYREDLEYMWTESVIKYNILNNGHFINMFKRMLLPLYDAIKNNNDIDNPAKGIERISNDDIKTIIESIAFMNYYLRPAEATGSHINPEEIDNFFSFFNLLLVWESLGNPYVIICSSRAANAFESYAQYLPQEKIPLSLNDKLNNKFIRCNHPSALSWFKKIKEIKKDYKKVWFSSKLGKRTSYEIQKEFYMSCPDFQINKNQ